MAKAERKGYTYWNTAIKAGVVGEEILWSDDIIHRDCTIGEIRQVIGSAYPIDLAVAFTLGSVGRDKGLTVKDMVNEHTRRATLLMSGYVGYGNLPVPETEDCGHDLISAREYVFPSIDISKRPYLVFTHSGGGLASQIKKAIPECNAISHSDTDWKTPSAEVLALMSYRLDSATTHEVTNAFDLLSLDAFAPLLEYIIECGYTKIKLNNKSIPTDSDNTMRNHLTTGVCGWLLDTDKTCSHHNPTFESDWWMIKGLGTKSESFMQVWRTGRGQVTVSGGNKDQFKNTSNGHIQNMYEGDSWNQVCKIPKDKVVRFSTHAREMINAMNDKEVMKQIRKALARMKNWSGRNLLDYDLNGRSKRGNYTLYSWSNWHWLDNIHTLATHTNSKNRAIGDRVCTKCYAAGHEKSDGSGNGTCIETCNEGWMYEKYDQYRIHGHEVAKFRWVPIMGLGQNDGKDIPKPHVFCFDSWPTLNAIFRTQQEAQFSRKLMTGSLNRMNAIKIGADWDEATNARLPVSENDMKEGGLGFSTVVPLQSRWIVLPAEIHPEEFSTAYDLFMGAVTGSPDFFDEFSEYITSLQLYRSDGSTYNSMTIYKPKIIPIPEPPIGKEEVNTEVTIDE